MEQCATGGGTMLAETWSQLQKQRTDLEERSAQLEAIRRRFEQYTQRDDRQSTLAAEARPLRSVAQPEITTYDELPGGNGRRVGDQLAPTSGADPVAMPNASRQRLRFSAAAGVLVVLLVLTLTDFHFQVGAEVGIDPSVLTAEQLQSHRVELTQELNLLTAAVDSSVVITDPFVLSAPDRSSLHLGATASGRESGRNQLQTLAERYVERVNQQQSSELLDAETHLAALDAELVVTRQNYDAMLGKLTVQQEAIASADPGTELGRLLDGVRQAREEFQRVEVEMGRTQAELEALRSSDVPQRPEVDLASRRQAAENDLYLQQDLKALGVRLDQLRRHLLAAFADSPGVLRDYSSAIHNLSASLEGWKLNLEHRQTLEALQALSAKAADLGQLVREFQKRWKQHGEDLQGLTIDPQDKTCLEMQRSVEDLVKNFIFDANGTMEELQPLYQKLSGGLGESAEHFKLRNALVAELKLVSQQQSAFAEFAKRLMPDKDFQLSAILHTVVGLTRRAADRQTAIETELAIGKRRELEGEMTTRLQAAQTKLDDLRGQREVVLSTILALQDQLGGVAPRLEEHGATVAVVPYTQARVEDSSARLEQVQIERQRVQERISTLRGSCGALKTQGCSAALWPVDAWATLFSAGFGGIGTAALSYLLLGRWPVAKRRADAIVPSSPQVTAPQI